MHAGNTRREWENERERERDYVDPMIAVEQRYFVGHKCWLTVKSTLLASFFCRRASLLAPANEKSSRRVNPSWGGRKKRKDPQASFFYVWIRYARETAGYNSGRRRRRRRHRRRTESARCVFAESVARIMSYSPSSFTSGWIRFRNSSPLIERRERPEYLLHAVCMYAVYLICMNIVN